MKRSVLVQSQSQYFSPLFFVLLSLLSCFSLLSWLEKRVSGGQPSPGPHHSLPVIPKEAEPSTKAAVIAILHSPRRPESHIGVQNAPSPLLSATPPVDRDGPERATAGYLQREEPSFNLNGSGRAGGAESFRFILTQQCHR